MLKGDDREREELTLMARRTEDEEELTPELDCGQFGVADEDESPPSPILPIA